MTEISDFRFQKQHTTTIFKEKLLWFPLRNFPGESECPEKWPGTVSTGTPGRQP